MRTLSKIEKDIVRQLIPKGKGLSQLLGGIGKEIVLKVDKESEKLEVIIKNHKKGRKVDKNELYEFYIKRLFFINTLMKLIVLLDNTGYIITYNFGKTSNNTIYIGDDALIEEIEKIDCKKIIFNIEDEFLISKFIKYCESYIAGTEELNEFVKNGFKTPEQKRFKKTFNISVIAIIISLLFGVISLWLNIKNKELPIRINESQLNSIVFKLDTLNKSTNKSSSIQESKLQVLMDKVDTLNNSVVKIK